VNPEIRAIMGTALLIDKDPTSFIKSTSNDKYLCKAVQVLNDPYLILKGVKIN